MNSRRSLWQSWPFQTTGTLLLAVAIRLFVAILDGSGAPVIVSRALGCLIAVAAMLGLARIGWLRPAPGGSPQGLLPPQPARGLLLGALTGAVLYGGIVLVAAIAGWYAVQAIRFDAAALLTALALLLFAAAFEELLFRGLLFQSLETALGTGWALALSGALFGGLHLGNTGATWMGGLAVGLAGVALGAVFALTRDLWLLTGLHLTWNFVQGPVFGVAVSGNSFQSLVQPLIQGPELFTGGTFGFEAGALTIALCLGASVWLVQRTRQAGHWRHPGAA